MQVWWACRYFCGQKSLNFQILTRKQRTFFFTFFPKYSNGHLPCSSDRVAPKNKLDVLRVSAQNPKEKRKNIYVSVQKKSCGEFEFSSDNHSDVFFPKVQKILVQYPRTKKNHFFLQKCFFQMIPVDTIDAIPKDRPKVFSQNSEKLPLKTWKES